MANYSLGNLIWKIVGNTVDFDKNLTASEQKISKFAGMAQKTGKKLTTFLTLPIAAAGVATVKAASDLGESLNAVNVVFGDSVGIINEFGETAAQSAGLSQSAFNGLATVIGAQLKQSGLDIDDVAERTVELTQRSADLASVFNVDVTEATGALGAALRGESEPARRFGINISDAAVQAEALATGLVKSKNEITDQIKVQARYSLILKQSADVAGDFANTSDNLANKSRILKADLVNVSAELGQQLIPIATDLVGVISDAVSTFGDLDEGTKKLILTIAGAAAATGPILMFAGGIGKAAVGIKVLTGLIKTMNLVALAGPLGVIALLGAAVLAVKKLSDAKNKRGLDELAESINGVADAAELSDDTLEKLGTTISREISKGNTDMLGFQDRIKELAEELGISEDKVLDVAVASGKLVGQYKDQAIQLKSIRDRWTGIEESLDRGERAAQAQADKWTAIEQSVNDARQSVDDYSDAQEIAALKEQSRLEGVIEARKTVTENFNKEIDLIERKADLELLTQEEVIEAKLSAEEKFQDQLLEIGYDGLENAQGQLDIGDEQLLDSIERRKGFEQQLKTDTLALTRDIFNGRASIAEEWSQAELARILETYEAEKKAAEDTAEKYVTNFTSAFEAVGEALYNQGDAWEAVGRAALGTIAEVIRALGRQLAAEAALLYAKAFFTGGATLPSAIAATVGSAAAFTAAGIVEASAQDFETGGFVQPRPGVSNTGDQIPARLNPGEVVLTQDDARELLSAIRGGGMGGQIVINNTLNTDSQKSMERAARQLYPYMQREAVRRG